MFWSRKPEKPEKGTVVEINLGPDDILVIKHPGLITDETCQQIRVYVGELLDKDGRQAMVLPGGMSVEVIHRTKLIRQKVSVLPGSSHPLDKSVA